MRSQPSNPNSELKPQTYESHNLLCSNHPPRYLDYDIYARICNDEKRLLAVPAPASLLDLCCGMGHLAADLTRRGYTV